MMGIAEINLVIIVSGLIISILGLFIILISGKSNTTRNFFIAFFSILTAYVLFYLIYQITELHSGLYWAYISRILLFIGSFLPSVLTVMITGLLLYMSGDEEFRKQPTFLISLGSWIIYVILLTYTQFSGVFYYIDDDNVYRRGPYYPVLLIPPVLIMVVNLVTLWQKRDKLTPVQRRAFVIYATIPLISMLIQMGFYGILVVILGTVVASMFMLLFIIQDKTERYYRQEAENAELRINLLIGQIQPHFLYNSLATIKQLCTDSPGAQDAIGSFTTFLRYNIDSLMQVVPIPFETELKHVQAYLDLEKLRFGDELTVEYDLQATDFMLPTLTVEPLVENAVRYGVRGREDGTGTIRIASYEYDDHYEVCVSDNGPGFDPEEIKNDGRLHIGIENARERLARVCGGELEIESVMGQGTRVIIRLPKDQQGHR